MGILLWILLVVGIILLFVGGFVAAVKFLLFVGIVLAALAVIGWIVRAITGRSRT